MRSNFSPARKKVYTYIHKTRNGEKEHLTWFSEWIFPPVNNDFRCKVAKVSTASWCNLTENTDRKEIITDKTTVTSTWSCNSKINDREINLQEFRRGDLVDVLISRKQVQGAVTVEKCEVTHKWSILILEDHSEAWKLWLDFRRFMKVSLRKIDHILYIKTKKTRKRHLGRLST